MKQLSKIIFLNSADYLYQSIELGGNVHLAGAEGVGKTTTLRGILYFYNADAKRLKIKTTMKPFFEHYFPYEQSYIVYEVDRGEDEGVFSVVVSKSGSGPHWTFINGKFDEDKFIEPLTNNVRYIAEIKQLYRETGVEVSSFIDKKESYLDIIYGNVRNIADKSLHKYRLADLENYANLIRIIENVFYNDEIKSTSMLSTIVSSVVDDPDFQVNLYNFRDSFAKLDRNYEAAKKFNDIKEDIVSDIIKELNHTKELRENLRCSLGKLNFLTSKATCDLADLESKKTVQQEKIRDLKNEESELSKSFDGKREVLNKDLGAVEIKLEDCKRARRNYTNIDILGLLSLQEQENLLKTDLESYASQINTLNDKNKEIQDKCKEAIKSVEIQKDKKILDVHKLLEERKQPITKEVESLVAKKTEEKEKISDSFEKKIKVENSAIEDIHAVLQKLNFEKGRKENEEPYKEEISRNEDIIKVKKDELTSNKGKRGEIDKDISNEVNSYKYQKQKLETEIKAKVNKLKAEINKINKDICKDKELLDKIGNSFSAWLDDNIPSWKNSIGKVVKEELLYSDGLKPSLAESHDSSLMGVNINVDSLDCSFRSSSDIEENLLLLRNSLDKVTNELENTETDGIDRLKSMEDEYSRKIKKLRNENKELEVKGRLIETEIINATNKIEDLKRKQKEEIKNAIKDIDDKIRLQKEEEARHKTRVDELTRERDNKRVFIEDEYNKKSQILEVQLKKLVEEAQVEIDKIENETNISIEGLRKNCVEEIEKGSGTMVKELIEKLNSTKSYLDSIEKNRELVSNYIKDKKDLFDHEERWNQKKNEISLDRNALEKDFQSKIKSLRRDIVVNEEIFRNIESNGEIIKSFLDKTRLLHNELRQYSFCSDFHELSQTFPCSESYNEFLDKYAQLPGKYRSNKERLSRLNSDFINQMRLREYNAFSFEPIDCRDIEDNIRLANNIEEFVENDKVSSFFQVLSAGLVETLKSFVTEYSILKKSQKKLFRTVDSLNEGFKQRSFGDIIRNVELSIELNDSELLKTIEKLCQFVYEHGQDLQYDLFSSCEEDFNAVQKRLRELFQKLKDLLQDNNLEQYLKVEDLYKLNCRIDEGKNIQKAGKTKVNNVGSNSTDIMVKWSLNVLLLDIFAHSSANKDDFGLHLVLDEVGCIYNTNVKGMLKFANDRSFSVINVSPMPSNSSAYKYLYLLMNDEDFNHHAELYLTI